MGFMHKARSQLDNLASKADSALGGAGNDVERHYRDLGVLAYLEATGRPADAGERERVLGALRAMEQRGAIRSFALHTAQASVPPPPGSGGPSVPPAPGASPSAPPAPRSAPPPPTGATPPPHPPHPVGGPSSSHPADVPPPPGTGTSPEAPETGSQSGVSGVIASYTDAITEQRNPPKGPPPERAGHHGDFLSQPREGGKPAYLTDDPISHGNFPGIEPSHGAGLVSREAPVDRSERDARGEERRLPEERDVHLGAVAAAAAAPAAWVAVEAERNEGASESVDPAEDGGTAPTDATPGDQGGDLHAAVDRIGPPPPPAWD